MYKAYLVDDEPWVLVGLKNTFNWQNYNFHIIGESIDPFTALDQIIALKPDLVLLDIRMPELNGIDLMKKAKQAGTEAEFVFISGFAEFSYAREALQNGAFDFLLKPVEVPEANKLLQKLFFSLEQSRLEKDLHDFENLLEKTIDIPSFLGKRGFCQKYEYFQAVSIFHSCPEYTNSLFDATKCEYINLYIGSNKAIYIVNSNDNIENYINDLLFSNTNNWEIISASTISNSVYDLPRLVLEADIFSYNQFVNPSSKFSVYRKIKYEALNAILTNLNYAISNQSKSDTKSILQDFEDYIYQNNFGINECVYFWNQLYSLLHQKFADNVENLELGFSDHRQIYHRFRSLTSMCEYLDQVISALYVPDESFLISNQSFKNILDYINKHYSENLQLKELASKFYLNASYCCELFKKTTGKKFSEYLIDLRLKKACELLLDTDLTIQEISILTGYSDYYYFNRGFKKNFGVTPAQYKKSKR